MKRKLSIGLALALLISMLSCVLVPNVTAQSAETVSASERTVYDSAQTMTARTGSGVDTSPTRYGEWNGYGYCVNLSTSEVTLTSYEGEATDVELPAEVEGYPVTAIDSYAFSWTEITSVVIPDSIRSIGTNAFNNCEALRSVVIGDGMQTIGDYAFRGCTALTTINLPAGVRSIGLAVFEEAALMEDPTRWEDGLLYIDRHLIAASETCSGEVSVRDGTVTIAGWAFYYHQAITSVSLPEGLVGIGSEAFIGCNALSNITFPDSVQVVGSDTLLYTAYAENAGNWDGDILYCGRHLVQSDYDVASVVSVKDGTLTMAAQVLSYAYEMRLLRIPTSIKYIGDQAIYTGDSLNAVAYAGTEEQWYAIGNVPMPGVLPVKFGCDADEDYFYTAYEDRAEILYYAGNEQGTLVIPATFGGMAVTSIGRNAFENAPCAAVVIPETVTVIGKRAFYGCEQLTSIEWPSSLAVIEEYAFYGNLALQTVALPDTVESIGDYAFASCESLEVLTLSASLESIGESAFEYDGALQSVVIPEGVKTIGDYAFYECAALTSIGFPQAGVERVGSCAFMYTAYWNEKDHWDNGVLYVGGCLFYADGSVSGEVTVKDGTYIIADGAFYYCTELTQVRLPEGVRLLGESAFRDCSSLEAINLPQSLVSIGQYAFSYCGSLAAVELPPALTTIEAELFAGCTSLETVAVPDGVETIGRYAFAWCSNLREVTVGEGVREIKDFAFSRCSALETVTVSEGLQTIAKNAFEECVALVSITLPESLERVEDFAFWWCDALTDVVYGGSPSSWTAITFGSDNDALLEATLHCAKEDEVVSLPGDIDGDGTLSSADTRDFLDLLVFSDMNFTEEETERMDLNHDDIINTIDIRLLLCMLVTE